MNAIIMYELNKIGPEQLSFLRVCVHYRLYFKCAHSETTDNIDFYSESAAYINYKVYGVTMRKVKNLVTQVCFPCHGQFLNGSVWDTDYNFSLLTSCRALFA